VWRCIDRGCDILPRPPRPPPLCCGAHPPGSTQRGRWPSADNAYSLAPAPLRGEELFVRYPSGPNPLGPEPPRPSWSFLGLGLRRFETILLSHSIAAHSTPCPQSSSSNMSSDGRSLVSWILQNLNIDTKNISLFLNAPLGGARTRNRTQSSPGTGNPTVNWQAVILYTRIQMIPRDCTAGARGIHSVYSGIFIQQQQHTWLQL
jgi:hypothetical protein